MHVAGVGMYATCACQVEEIGSRILTMNLHTALQLLACAVLRKNAVPPSGDQLFV